MRTPPKMNGRPSASRCASKPCPTRKWCWGRLMFPVQGRAGTRREMGEMRGKERVLTGERVQPRTEPAQRRPRRVGADHRRARQVAVDLVDSRVARLEVEQ